jgi:hypothetical protein
MSKPNPARLRAVILEVVNNQLRDNTPPETKRNLKRLVAEGYSIEKAKRLIGVVSYMKFSMFCIARNSMTKSAMSQT